MTVLFVARATWHTGPPTSNTGTPRPLLQRPVPTITRHYTGVAPSSKARNWTAAQFMPDFQRIALNGGKSFEYNYIIPPRADGSSQVWEYAGDYRAAHSEGENAVALGVLFAIGVSNHPSSGGYDPTKPTVWEPLTDEMVRAYQWLRDRLLAIETIVVPSVKEIEHRDMPGAATACPGLSVITRKTDLNAPYQEDEMPEVRYFKRSATGPTIWATSDGLNAWRLEPYIVGTRGVDVNKVPEITPTEASTMLYHDGGLPDLSTR